MAEVVAVTKEGICTLHMTLLEPSCDVGRTSRPRRPGTEVLNPTPGENMPFARWEKKVGEVSLSMREAMMDVFLARRCHRLDCVLPDGQSSEKHSSLPLGMITA